ncbi:MAG: DUF2281 domain-containing protein [Chloroflexia bacterium]|nr:DUF2281 domain-containing protein [Chloroflexia bacterium]
MGATFGGGCCASGGCRSQRRPAAPVKQAKQPRRPGSAKGMIHLANDFDAPLEDFREYMT